MKKQNVSASMISQGHSAGVRFNPTLCFTFLLVLFMVLFVLSSSSRAATYVSGNIIADTTWSKAKSPYIVTGNILVISGVTLTIEPGVAVKFDGNYAITLDGTFIAEGTLANNILFTTNQAGTYWGYIIFRDSSTDAVYDIDGKYVSGSIMKYCLVEYAGAADITNNGALRMNNAHPFINHCLIRNNHTRGICAWGLTGTLKITDGEIRNNITSEYGGGIYVQQSFYPNPNPYGYSRISNNTISGNECTRNGGGIYAIGSKMIVISKNIIRDNLASGSSSQGGGIACGRADTEITENVVIQNTASTIGGGMIGPGQITNNIICQNQAPDGGGTHNSGCGTVNPAYKLANNSFIGNEAENYPAFNLCYNSIISQNLFTGNKATGPEPTYALVVTGTKFDINFNNIFENTATYELFNNNKEGTPDIDAANNWWGTAMLSEIEARVYDGHLDDTLGLVDYIPWDTALRTDVPISPPQGVHVNQAYSTFTLTWQANAEADLTGYKIYWGSVSGFPYANVRDVGKVTSYTFRDLPPGPFYFVVTAYDSDYHPDNDDPQTLINENQTAGHESWFSREVNTVKKTALPFLMLLLDN